MKLTKLIVALFATLAFGTALAGDPKPVDRDCSPGYYKNKGYGDWQEFCGSECDKLNQMLNANRNSAIMDYFPDLSPGQVKNMAADLIVLHYLGKEGEMCEEASQK